MKKYDKIVTAIGIGGGFIALAFSSCNSGQNVAYPGPCPIGQSQCMVIPGYNAPTWTDPRWSDRRDGMPGQWGPNSGYTPITVNPYHPSWR